MVLRNIVSLPIVLFMAWRLGGLRHMSAFRNPMVVSRSVLEGTGTLAFVAALPFITLGQSAVILLTVPIILVALSALIYREDVGWRRWTAIVVGFFGVVLVANPFGGQFNVYLLVAQFTAITWAFRDLMTSRILGRIPTITVALINTVVVGLLAVPGALWQEWRGFGGEEALYLLGSGQLVAFANFLYIDALRTGAIPVVAPFRYTAAIWASIAGFIVWGDIPDWLGVVGTLFIIGSGLYTFYAHGGTAELDTGQGTAANIASGRNSSSIALSPAFNVRSWVAGRGGGGGIAPLVAVRNTSARNDDSRL